MKEGEEFWLDWETCVLQGWEFKKSELVVAAIREGIKHGDDFPPVIVYQVGDVAQRVFCIAPSEALQKEESAGGHHRAFGHHQEETKLKCLLVRKPHLPHHMGNKVTRDIRTITLVPDAEAEEPYAAKKARFADYRPVPGIPETYQ